MAHFNLLYTSKVTTKNFESFKYLNLTGNLLLLIILSFLLKPGPSFSLTFQLAHTLSIQHHIYLNLN